MWFTNHTSHYPRQARHFAKATGKLTKTDKVDARVLAHFGEAVKPKVRLPDDKKVDLTACMRKLLVILNSMIKKQRSWSPEQIPAALP